MASYHLSAKIIGRSEGRSVVAAAAYRSGTKIERDEVGDAPDYTRKHGVMSSDLLVPEMAPDWAYDRSQLWNRVERKEQRKNSQLAREIEVALPNELNQDEARRLVLDWARTELVQLGMVADVSIHDPDPGEHGNRNRHAHILCTMRPFGNDGYDGWAKKKDRNWNSTDFLQHWRESWSRAQNDALARAGIDERVTHKSLEDQHTEAVARMDWDAVEVLDRDPEPRIGVAATGIEKRAMAAAERSSQPYEPVTDAAREVREIRSLRQRLFAGIKRRIAGALRVDDPFDRSVPSSRDASPATEDPFEDTGPGL